MAAVRYVTTKGSSLLHLICHVKPGANSKREGIIAITDDVIELCVAAQPKDREANKAVRELVAKVYLGNTLSLFHASEADHVKGVPRTKI